MSLKEKAEAAYDNALAKGFHDGVDFTDIYWQMAKIALITSENSEALEALRKRQGERKVVEEICDGIIRALDFYHALKLAGVVESDIDEVYEEKSEKNKARPHMHGVRA